MVGGFDAVCQDDLSTLVHFKAKGCTGRLPRLLTQPRNDMVVGTWQHRFQQTDKLKFEIPSVTREHRRAPQNRTG
jgi:hypothetical protein